jgi:hypothetical protein
MRAVRLSPLPRPLPGAPGHLLDVSPLAGALHHKDLLNIMTRPAAASATVLA